MKPQDGGVMVPEWSRVGASNDGVVLSGTSCLLYIMETVYCAVCHEQLGLDSDHVAIDAEIKRINDRNDREDYAMHTECWRELSAEWVNPA